MKVSSRTDDNPHIKKYRKCLLTFFWSYSMKENGLAYD